MLSKILSPKEAAKLEFKPFNCPNQDDVHVLLEEKRRENQRKRILEDNKEDPVTAAKNEANRILIEAQDKLKAAEVEANLLKNRKEKELRLQLEKEFQAKLEEQLNQTQQNYVKTLDELSKLKQTIYKKSENQLLELVFSITKKIIESEIKTSPDIVLNLLKKSFEKIKDASTYEIKINPIDYDNIVKRKNELSETLKITGTIKFTKDEHVERGGCHIISEQGEISSEPSKQLDIIMRELSDGT